jgi:hypothetical protein
MLDRHDLPDINPYRQEIKTIPISAPAIAQPPIFRRAADGPTLLPPYGFERCTACVRPAGLHFHERHQGPAPCDEIEVVPPESEAVRLDGPATGREVCECDALPP